MSRFRLKLARQSYRQALIPPTVGSLSVTVLSATTARLDFTEVELAVHYEYSLDGGAFASLAPTRIITGLTGSTAYSVRIRGVDEDGATGAPTPAAAFTTAAATPTPGTVADLTATAISPSEVQLSFTTPADAPAMQYRLDGGAAQTLDVTKIVSGLEAATEYDFEVRGADALLAVFGDWSNLVSETTDAAVVGFDPLETYLTEDEYDLAIAAGASITPTQIWGLSRPLGDFTDYTPEPAYNYATDIPGNALDRSNYASLTAWLADMEVQQKPGKIGSGTYTLSGTTTTIGTQSIYGYGVTKPIITGAWHHYVQGDNCVFQYLDRRSDSFWLVAQDNHSSFMTSSRYLYTNLEGAGAQYKRLADHTGFKVLDCAFDALEYPILLFHENYRLSNVVVARNVYRNNCRAIVTGNQQYFGQILCYLNDLEGAYHGRAGSPMGTVIYFGAEITPTAARDTNGPTYVENNRIVDVRATVLPKRDDNIACAVDTRGSNRQYQRYNEIEDVTSDFHAVDCQAFYAKGTTYCEENYIRGTGSSSHIFGYDALGTGADDLDGWNPDEAPGSETAAIAFKGGGGNAALGIRSTQNRNLIIPRFGDGPILENRHTGEIRDNVFISWHANSANHYRRGLIVGYNPGSNLVVGANHFVDCSRDTYAPREDWLLFNDGGTPGMQADGIRADFGRLDCFQGVQSIVDCKNLAGSSDLTNQSTYAPTMRKRPRLTLAGGVFSLTDGEWGVGLAPTSATVLPHTYKWQLNGVDIPGQTANTLSESYWTGTIEGVVITTVSDRTTMAKSEPMYKIVSELASTVNITSGWSGNLASITKTVTGSATVFEVPVTLTAGLTYRVRWTQTSSPSTGYTHVGVRNGSPSRGVPLHMGSRAATYEYLFEAIAGENAIRFTTTGDAITITNISVGMIE